MGYPKSLLVAALSLAILGCSTAPRDAESDIVPRSEVSAEVSSEEIEEQGVSLFGEVMEEESDADILVLQLESDLQKNLLKLSAERKIEMDSVRRNSALNHTMSDKMVDAYKTEIANLDKLTKHYSDLVIPEGDAELKEGVELILRKFEIEKKLLDRKITQRINELETQQVIEFKVAEQEVIRKFAIDKAKLLAQHDYDVSVVRINEESQRVQLQKLSSATEQLVELEKEVADISYRVIEMGVDNL